MRGAIGELTGGSRRREEEKEELEEEEESDVGVFEVNQSTRAFIDKIKSWSHFEGSSRELTKAISSKSMP